MNPSFVRPRPKEHPDFREPCVLRVKTDCRVSRRSFELYPQRPSKPFALLCWGYRPESTLWGLRVGTEEQLVQPVPLSVFSSMLDYPDFESLCERRADGHDAIRALWRLFRYQELDFDTTLLGTSIAFDVEGPFEHIVLLATMPVIDPR